MVTNLGNTAVERNIFVRFSAQPRGAGQPNAIFSQAIPRIEAGESLTLDVALPFESLISEGEYTLLVEVDPDNSSGDVFPNNNAFQTDGVFRVKGEPEIDLAATMVSVSAATVMAGEMLGLTGVLANLKADPSGLVEYAIVLSADDAYDPMGDRIVGRGMVDDIAGDSMVNVELDVLIPLDLDQQTPQWFVGLVVDPDRRVLGEEADDRVNNVVFADAPITVTGSMGGCAEDTYEPNDESATSKPLPMGLTENLGSCGNSDWFEVTVPAGAVISVINRWASAEGTLSLTLTDNRGVSLIEGTGYGGFLEAFLVPIDEERTVLVRVDSQENVSNIASNWR